MTSTSAHKKYIYSYLYNLYPYSIDRPVYDELKNLWFSGRKKQIFANVYFTTPRQLIVHLWRGSSCQRPCPSFSRYSVNAVETHCFIKKKHLQTGIDRTNDLLLNVTSTAALQHPFRDYHIWHITKHRSLNGLWNDQSSCQYSWEKEEKKLTR